MFDDRVFSTFTNLNDSWNFSDFAGDGNGFKLGGGAKDTAVAHSVKNSIGKSRAEATKRLILITLWCSLEQRCWRVCRQHPARKHGYLAQHSLEQHWWYRIRFCGFHSHHQRKRTCDINIKSIHSLICLVIQIAVLNKVQYSLNTATSSGNSWQSGTWSNSSFKSIDSSILTGARSSTGAIVASNFLLPASGAAIGAAYA